MLDARKTGIREAGDVPAAPAVTAVGPAVPAAADPIGDLLGERAVPAARSRWRRPFLWLLLLAPLAGMAAPGYLWVVYQSQHVISKNAAVRGHVAEIGSRLTGVVAAVTVDAGDRVTAGQVLVQFEDSHLNANVQEARAAVAGLERSIEVEQAAIELETREVEQRQTESTAIIAAAAAQTETARIAAEDARRLHELQESLYKDGGAVSSTKVSDAEYLRRAAEARLQEAKANALVISQSTRKEIRQIEDALTIRKRKLKVTEAELMGARARVARAEADLQSAAIRAPEDGAVVRRIIQPGSSIDVGQPVISLWLGKDIWVEAWIDEEDLGHVRVGHTATVRFHMFPDEEFTGTVETIGLATDMEIPETEVPQPRFARMRGAPAVGVRIRLQGLPKDLVPGLSAVVAIGKQAPAVPAPAKSIATDKKE